MYIFFFECGRCRYQFVLNEGGDGWVDSQGQFGYALHPDWEPIGEPHGHPEPVYYYNGICIDCNRIYTLIHSIDDVNIPLEHEPVSSDGKCYETVYVMPTLAPEFRAHDEYREYNYAHLQTLCPICDQRLISGSELLPRVTYREKARKFGLTPMPEGQDCEVCPKCKKHSLEFRQLWVS